MKLWLVPRGRGPFDNAPVNLNKETLGSGSLSLDIGIDQLPVNLPSRGKLPENLLEFGCR